MFCVFGVVGMFSLILLIAPPIGDLGFCIALVPAVLAILPIREAAPDPIPASGIRADLIILGIRDSPRILGT